MRRNRAGCVLVIYIGSCQRDLEAFPEEVREVVLAAIDWAELGERHPATKVLRGFGGAGVIEVVDRFKGDAYRFVYTTKFPNAVYGLHAFKKKSTRGIATPKKEVELIRHRLKAAEIHSRDQQG